MGPQICVQSPDILPVALGDVTVERLAGRENVREHVSREIDRSPRCDEVEDLRFQDVDPRVDRVAEDLTPGRLLQKPFYSSVRIGDDDPELEGIVDGFESDRPESTFL